jgi:hypothetical protein
MVVLAALPLAWVALSLLSSLQWKAVLGASLEYSERQGGIVLVAMVARMELSRPVEAAIEKVRLVSFVL